MKTPSEFRLWINNLWQENCEERMCWGEPRLTPAEYFKTYKWILKREFQYQTRKNQGHKQ